MKRFISSMVLVFCCATAATACKNVCQKAGGHYLDCWQQFCEAHSDDDRCESRLDNPVAQAMVEASSCPNEDRANQILEASCDELTAQDGPGL